MTDTPPLAPRTGAPVEVEPDDLAEPDRIQARLMAHYVATDDPIVLDAHEPFTSAPTR